MSLEKPTRKARYFNMEELENSNTVSLTKTGLEKILNQQLVVGDVINLGSFRQGSSYIVGKTNKLIMNPDSSGSGYLTIPLKVSKLVPDAIKHFSNIIYEVDVEFTNLELSREDAKIKQIFKQPSRILEKGYFEYIPNENKLWIAYGKKYADFKMNAKQAYIEKALDVTPKFIPKPPSKIPSKKPFARRR